MGARSGRRTRRALLAKAARVPLLNTELFQAISRPSRAPPAASWLGHFGARTLTTISTPVARICLILISKVEVVYLNPRSATSQQTITSCFHRRPILFNRSTPLAAPPPPSLHHSPHCYSMQLHLKATLSQPQSIHLLLSPRLCFRLTCTVLPPKPRTIITNRLFLFPLVIVGPKPLPFPPLEETCCGGTVLCLVWVV